MARHEFSREDLMAEAVALQPRIALDVAPLWPEVVAGLRQGGRWSVYFGEDPVYHFESAGALRRAYVGGKLYRSEGATLSALTRVRTASETQLLRYDLSQAANEQFITEMRQHVSGLLKSLTEATCSVRQQIPATPDCRPDLICALQVILATATPLAPPLK